MKMCVHYIIGGHVVNVYVCGKHNIVPRPWCLDIEHTSSHTSPFIANISSGQFDQQSGCFAMDQFWTIELKYQQNTLSSVFFLRSSVLF